MKKRVTFTVDEDVFESLRMLPRGMSVSDFVNFMLRGMVKAVVEEAKGGWTQEAFEEWANSDPQRKKVRDELGRLKKKIKK